VAHAVFYPTQIVLHYIKSQIQKKVNSPILKAASIDDLSDVAMLSVAVLSIIFAKNTNIQIDGFD
jgi:divalent metal cation (Fe/Co/Zn/Cd) transporter